MARSIEERYKKIRAVLEVKRRENARNVFLQRSLTRHTKCDSDTEPIEINGSLRRKKKHKASVLCEEPH